MYRLSVTLAGDGGGRVTSVPAGIDCPGTCDASFPQGTRVALAAAPDALSKLTSYGGACDGGDCAVGGAGDAVVTAQFDLRRYVAEDLGAPAAASDAFPAGISPAALLVAGSWGTGAGAFLWNGSTSDLGLAQGSAAAVNDVGIVVGTASFGTDRHAFQWQGGAATDLGTLGGAESSAQAVSADGTIAGSARCGDGQLRAVTWGAAGIVDLGSLGEGANACSAAYGINSQGVVVGESCTPAAGVRAVRFRAPGVIDDLGSLGGYSSARAINASGVIIGVSQLPAGDYRSFVYADGKMTDVGILLPLGMRADTILSAINGTAIAVGKSGVGGATRGVIYGAGRLIDLNPVTSNTPGLIDDATGIDDAGNIVAHGWDGSAGHALLLRPQ
jgi:probable HAF family extracellular repeat protein